MLDINRGNKKIFASQIKDVEDLSKDVHLITFDDEYKEAEADTSASCFRPGDTLLINYSANRFNRKLYLIGTAHVSPESVRVVEETIYSVKPDTVAIELDSQRLDIIKNKKKYEETDVIQIIKSKKVLFFIAQLMMSSFQKRIAKKFGVKPGAEFIKAVELAENSGLHLVLADRNIGITLKRLVRMLSFWDKCKLFFSFLFSHKEEKNIDEKKIEELKELNNLNELIEEMGKVLPPVKKVLLDERNAFLAEKIKQNLGEKTVAVVGAAHVPGIIECLKSGNDISLNELEIIPPKSKSSKILPWIFPVIILGLFVLGFMYGNYEKIGHAAVWWVLVNGILTSIGCLIALGHPVTIIVGFFAAPITSLNPTIGAGMVVGLVQLFLVRPKVKDFETVADDITNLKRIWKNRLTRVLLVFVLGSLGSSIGTFVALPFVLKIVA